MGWYSSKPTPLEALDEAILYGFVGSTHPFKKPGAIISRLPASQREALSRLTPEDTQRVRVDWLFGASRRRGRFNLPSRKEP